MSYKNKGGAAGFVWPSNMKTCLSLGDKRIAADMFGIEDCHVVSR